MRNHFIALSLFCTFVSSLVPDPIRLHWEAESRRWFFWLLLAGAVVALGCILEIPETRFSLTQWWRQKRGRPAKEENPTNWRVPAASVGLLLVIFGVLGEVMFEGLASNAESKLEGHESQVLSTAETYASAANERATAAYRRAAATEKTASQENHRAAESLKEAETARSKAEAARAKAEGLELQIAEADERASAANRAAAEANKTAEQERLAQLRLEARLADRVITPEQQKQLEAVLALLKGQTVDIGVIGDSVEISNVSRTLMRCMRSQGILLNVRYPVGGSSAKGILIGLRPDAPDTFKNADSSMITILSRTLRNGVGRWDFNALDISKKPATAHHDKGALSWGQSPLRIIIGGK